jgi:tetratricopeptide (TPR) repeat protein
VPDRVCAPYGILGLRHRLGNIALRRGDLAGARKVVEESLRRARASGHRYEESDFLGSLGELEFREGNIERALELYLSALALVREVGGWAWG